MEKKTWVKVGTVMKGTDGSSSYVAVNVGGNPKKDGEGAVKILVKTARGWEELKPRKGKSGKDQLNLSVKDPRDNLDAERAAKIPEYVSRELIVALDS